MAFHGLTGEDRFEASCQGVLDKYGVTLELGSDFATYRALLAEGRSDHTIGAPFDPEIHHLDTYNGVWVVGRDADGVIMHTQALRLLDLQGQNLGKYLRRYFRDFPPSGLPLDMERSKYRAGPGAKNIAGQVVYHGEVWMGGRSGQFRGSGMSSILGRFAFLTAIRKWAPDYMIGFMPKQVANKGFVSRQGYMHVEPFALNWYLQDKPDPLEGMMVYMSLEDMRFVLDMPQSDIEALAA
ncbi:MAG: hypothetical protein AB8B71_06000 [Paracoccaceae bacterium]